MTNVHAIAAVSAAMVIVPASARAGTVQWHRLDRGDVTLLGATDPTALHLLEDGTRRLDGGDVDGAVKRLRDAATRAPRNGVVLRKWCEALAAGGRRREAIDACHRAVLVGSSPLLSRASAAAFVAGEAPPTTDDAVQAMGFARAARDSLPDEPWGYAAECDVARRLGDARMLDVCTRELVAVAPDHDETKRALALDPRRRGDRIARFSWVALAVALVGTALHAAVRALRRSSRATTLMVAVVVLLPSRVFAADAPGDPFDDRAPTPEELERASQSLSDVEIDPEHPENSLPAVKEREKDPLKFAYILMDLNDRAAAATRTGDHRAAVRYLEALTKAVPDESLPFTKLCAEYRALGERRRAIESCAAALGRHGARISDFRHYADLILEKEGGLTKKEVAALDGVARHLTSVPSAGNMGAELDCELGVRTEDAHRLERCVPILTRAAPRAASTVSYEWALAILRGDARAADSALSRARSSGISGDALSRMERVTRARRPLVQSLMAPIGLGALAAVCAAALRGSIRRRRIAQPS